jgi:hypothetical protein
MPSFGGRHGGLPGSKTRFKSFAPVLEKVCCSVAKSADVDKCFRGVPGSDRVVVVEVSEVVSDVRDSVEKDEFIGHCFLCAFSERHTRNIKFSY